MRRVEREGREREKSAIYGGTNTCVRVDQTLAVVELYHLRLLLDELVPCDLVGVDDHLEELVPRRRRGRGVVVVLHVGGGEARQRELRRIAQNCAELRGSAP